VRPTLRLLPVEALSRENFAAFGDVICAENAARRISVNAGTAVRHHDLARVDTTIDGGRTVLSLFRAQPRALPFEVRMLERHPLGSQAFIPLDPACRYLVVVASAGQASPRAFLASHSQGVNFHRGTWHHPLLLLDQANDFLVIDREGEGDNCEEWTLPEPWLIEDSRPG